MQPWPMSSKGDDDLQKDCVPLNAFPKSSIVEDLSSPGVSH